MKYIVIVHQVFVTPVEVEAADEIEARDMVEDMLSFYPGEKQGIEGTPEFSYTLDSDQWDVGPAEPPVK